MTDQERIEELKSTVPTVRLTVRQKLIEALGWVCSAVAVVALVVAVLATQRAANVGNCINSILGNRNGLSTSDTAVQLATWKQLQKVLGVPKDQQARQYALFVGDLTTLVTTLTTDQAYRSSHPLGEC